MRNSFVIRCDSTLDSQTLVACWFCGYERLAGRRRLLVGGDRILRVVEIPARQRVARRELSRRAPSVGGCSDIRRRAGERAERHGVGLPAERERGGLAARRSAAGRCESSACTCGRLPAADCRMPRPASVGAPSSVKPDPVSAASTADTRRRRTRCLRRIGPPSVPPNWLSREGRALSGPRFLSRLVRAFSSLSGGRRTPSHGRCSCRSSSARSSRSRPPGRTRPRTGW